MKDQAALARLVGVSRARVTQVMDLLYLAPDLQEGVLFGSGIDARSEERGLRAVAAGVVWEEQRDALARLMAQPHMGPG